MDLSEMIKSYTPDQKNVFTAFCINWPLAFSCCYAYELSFRSLAFQLQLIFSASASILSISITYLMLFIYYNILKAKKRNIEIGILSSLGIIISFVLLIRTNSYGNGAKEAITFAKMALLLPLFELILISIKKEQKDKRQTKKNITSDSGE